MKLPTIIKKFGYVKSKVNILCVLHILEMTLIHS